MAETTGLLMPEENEGAWSWGGLLGGPRDSIIEPIIGEAAIKDARRNALLNFGMAMLANSGYSRTPVSLGQALASGLQGAQGGYAGSLDSALKGAATAQQIEQRKQEMARRQAFLDLAAGNTPQMPAGGSAPQMPAPGGVVGSPPPGAPSATPQAGTPGMPDSTVGAAGGAPQPPPVGAAALTAATLPRAQPRLTRDQAYQMMTLMPEWASQTQAMYEMANPEAHVMPDGTVVPSLRDPSIVGQNFAALPPGMIRLPDGTVVNAPGAVPAMYAQAAAQEAAKRGYELVDVVVPGQGTMKVPRMSVPGMMGGAPVGLAPGPNGMPQPVLGGMGGALSAEDPASLEERKGDVASFLKAKEAAMTAAQTATESLPQLEQIDALIRDVKPGFGKDLQYEWNRVLEAAGALSDEGKEWTAQVKEFQNLQKQQAMSSLKAFAGYNPSNLDLRTATETLGKISDPAKAVRFTNDIRRVTALRQQAYADFLQNYDGSRGRFEQAWRNSPEAKRGVYDYPNMWKYLPVTTGKPKTPAAGKSYVKTPSGNIYAVQLNEHGEPVPVDTDAMGVPVPVYRKGR